MRKFRGWAKTALSRFEAEVYQIWGAVGESLWCGLTGFFQIVDIMFRCRYIFGQSSKSVSKAGSVISEYVSKFG